MIIKQFMNTILDESNEIVYLADPVTYDLLYANKAARTISGISEDCDLAGMKCYNAIHNCPTPCEFCTNHLLSSDEYYTWEYQSARAQRYFLMKDKLIQLDGRDLRLEIAVDITDREELSRALCTRLSAEETLVKCIQTLNSGENIDVAINSLLEHITDFYEADRAYIFEINKCTHTAGNTYEYCAPGVTPMINQMQSIPLHKMAPILDELDEYKQFILSAEQNNHIATFLLPSDITKVIMVPLTDKTHDCIGFMGVDNPRANVDSAHLLSSVSYFCVDDIHKRKLIDRLKQMTYVDSLTGLKNRNSYIKKLQELQKTQQSLGVVFLDINGLKKANDTHGHTYGDSLIVRAANLLTKVFEDDVFRIGGDEFVILCANMERNEFYHHVERLRKLAERDELCNLSIGARWDDGNVSTDDLIASADELMYINKQSYYHASLDDSPTHRALMIKELISAIDSGNYVVYLQPKVDLTDRSIFGAEALVRMKGKDGKLIAPINFIHTLESENAIRYVDFFVLETVCKTLADWKMQGINLIHLSVNFSRVTLLESDVVENMLKICDKYHISPTWITIEVTESIGTMEMTKLRELIHDIKIAGFSVSLDDFGSQYSNLSLLSSIDFDELKFDKSMVDNLADNHKSQIIMRYAIDMGLSLNDTISVAEGIETPDQLKLLLQMNCRFGQGYLFSKPVSIEEFERMLNLPA